MKIIFEESDKKILDAIRKAKNGATTNGIANELKMDIGEVHAVISEFERRGVIRNCFGFVVKIPGGGEVHERRYFVIDKEGV